MLNNKSKLQFEIAKDFFPGGVNSPVRAFKSVELDPPFIKRGKGAFLYDLDGNKYIDYVLSWGPLVLGHAHPKVLAAINKAAKNGTSFGAPHELEIKLAKKIQTHYPHLQKLRFTSSGTEATMSALRVARAFTGRPKILKFNGCYHGHSDSLLVAAGSGAATYGQPDSLGVTPNLVKDTVQVEYNDLEALKRLMAYQGKEIAAIIVEPVAGNMGLVLPHPEFLTGLRNLCDQYGSLLIFDEVLCGFRSALGGAREIYGVTADLTCLGKVVGGGLPVGVYGGRKEIMNLVAPLGGVYQAGTLSGNPIAMAAGLATLTELEKPATQAKLKVLGEQLNVGLTELKTKIPGLKIQVNQSGSLFGYFFNEKRVTNFIDAQRTNTVLFKKFYQAMLLQGIYLAPSAFEAGFISSAHTAKDIDYTLKHFYEILRSLS